MEIDMIKICYGVYGYLDGFGKMGFKDGWNVIWDNDDEDIFSVFYRKNKGVDD